MSVPPSLVTRTSGPAHEVGVRVPDPDRRFYAFAVDRLLAWGIDLVVAVGAVHYVIARGQTRLGVFVIVATVLVVGAAFALMSGTTGRTPGKALLGLRLVHAETGEPIGIRAAMARTFVLGVAAVPFGFGLAALAWTALADTTRLRRGWHDRLVSSVVMDTRPVPVAEEPADAGPRHVVNLTAMRLMPAGRAPAEPDPAWLPARADSPGRH
ncbi:MAG: RDD family protein, partial [Nocardioides sp.]|nr:RDD family protein [Nocardioides sp.]